MTEILIYGVDGMSDRVTQMLGEEHMPTIHGLQNEENAKYGEFESYTVKGYSVPHTGVCLTPDVEAYTKEGWKTYDDISVGDKVLSISADEYVEWKPVTRVIEQEHEGTVYDLDHSKINATITPDHKMAVKTDDGIERVLAKHTPSKFYVPTSGKQREGDTISVEIGERNYEGENFAELLGWYIADGNISDNEVRISKTIEEDRVQIQDLFEEFEFVPYGSNTNVSVYAPELATWLEEEIGKYSIERRIPRWVLSTASRKFLEKLFTTLMRADGKRDKHSQYFTSSKGLAEDFSELCIRLGYAPSITNRGGGIQEIKGKEYDVKDRYVVNIGERSRNTQIRKSRHWEEKEYEGKVWDLTVKDNHTFLVKRDGKMHFTSNCWPTLYTGLDETGHGHTEGGWRDGDSRFHDIYTVWDKLSEEDKELALFGMPMTYKAKDINGWMVSGFVHTTLKSLYGNALYPEDIVDNDFIENTAAYVAKVKHEEGMHPDMPEPSEQAYETFRESEFNRLDVFKELIDEHGAPDVAAYGTTFADKMGHADSIMPNRDITRKTYQDVDQILGELIDTLEPEHVIIISDHGFSGWTHDQVGYYLDTTGSGMDSIFDFAPTLLDFYDIEYRKEEYGEIEDSKGLSKEEKKDIRGQLADLGYIDRDEV